MSRGILVFRSDRHAVLLSYDDIIYISSMDHSIYITTAALVYRTRSFTMSALQELLSDSGFIRSHKSFIVNIRYIKGVSKAGIRLKECSDELPVGRRYVKNVRKIIREQQEM